MTSSHLVVSANSLHMAVLDEGKARSHHKRKFLSNFNPSATLVEDFKVKLQRVIKNMRRFRRWCQRQCAENSSRLCTRTAYRCWVNKCRLQVVRGFQTMISQFTGFLNQPYRLTPIGHRFVTYLLMIFQII